MRYIHENPEWPNFRWDVGGLAEPLAAVLHKARVWQQAGEYPLNERQRHIINRLLDNFQGKLTSGKYAELAKCSPDTALRDIRELMRYGILQQGKGGGRSTNYEFSDEITGD